MTEGTGLKDEEASLAQQGPEGSSQVSPGLGVALRALGVILATFLLGVGGYSIGRGSGEDLEAARAAGQAAGAKTGTARAISRGFSAGLRKGKKRGFDRAFPAAYKSGYLRAFESAGLEPPAKNQVKVPNK